jgi:hypothetical protein
MAIAIIDVMPTFGNEKEEILNDLMWFDPVDRVMHHFKGASLAYEYYDFKDVDVLVPSMGWVSGKTIAKPQKMFRTSQKKRNNLEAIMNWVGNNSEDLGLEILTADTREVVVQFPDDKKGEDKWKTAIEESLYSARFRYEIQNA